MARRLLFIALIVLLGFIGSLAHSAADIAQQNAKYSSELERLGLQNDIENKKPERAARRLERTVESMTEERPSLKRSDTVNGKLYLGAEFERRFLAEEEVQENLNRDAEMDARHEEMRAERENRMKERRDQRKEELRNRMREDRKYRGRDYSPDGDVDAMIDRHRDRHRDRHSSSRDRRGRGRGREKRKTAREVRHENIRNRIEKFQHLFTPEEHAQMDEDLKDHWDEEKKLDDERDRVNAQWEAVRDIDDRDERLDRLAYLKGEREKNRDGERMSRDSAREKFQKIRKVVDDRISNSQDLR